MVKAKDKQKNRKNILAFVSSESYESNRLNVAEFLHNTYEDLAKEVGWKTQKSCRVKFNDLPEANKKVMLGMADAVILLKLRGRD